MVKQGYKQTEIGVIPEDWEVKELVDMVELINGRAYSQNELLSRGKYRVLRVGNFFSSDKWYWSDLELANKFYVENGDLMYAWSASFGPKFWLEEKTIYHYHIWKIDNYRKTDKKFLYHLLVNDKSSIQNESQGGTMFHITKEAMEKRKFPLPPLAEQEAIAAALSDADAWIESLEQLIAKKRLIKQGAMQTLLTPKDDWEVKKLGEIVNFKNGAAHENVVDENGDYVIVNSKFISQEGRIRKFSNAFLCPLYKNEIVMVMSDIPNGKALAKCFIIEKDNTYTLNQRICAFEAKEGFDAKYLFYKINRNDYFLAFDSGSGQTNLRRDEVLNCPIYFPSLSEQERIARILSDMDAELEALEQQLAKARQIKQGMMQELLTGRVRLINVARIHDWANGEETEEDGIRAEAIRRLGIRRITNPNL